MIECNIPGQNAFTLEHLVLDYNGTLACDGHLVEGLKDLLEQLSGQLRIHVITADTFGYVHDQLGDMDLTIDIIDKSNQDQAKCDYIQLLGVDRCVSVGNGRNDALMLESSKLGIALIQHEGAAVKSVMAADIVCTHIHDALRLLLNPKRLIATLRN